MGMVCVSGGVYGEWCGRVVYVRVVCIVVVQQALRPIGPLRF